LKPTGWSSIETAGRIQEELLKDGIDLENEYVVATGYGRISVPYADSQMTEISCHGKGACFLHNSNDLVIVDIGGQDTKIIEVSSGKVIDFIMNDKCSAGTGRFLEVMGNTLHVDGRMLCDMAEEGGGVTISSLCTVFAESEVISLIGRGEKRENIAYAVIDSIANKVAGQASHIDMKGKNVCLTGGLCDYTNLRKMLGKKLSVEVNASPDGRYAGAIGAAILAIEKGNK
jgi:predicted CoA-substrate-specific enzyme activase